MTVAYGGLVPLTGFGTAFMLTGAGVVTAYAALENTGLRRLTAAP